MFQLRPLPRTLSAALRDAAHKKTSVRRSALKDLSRLARGDERDEAVRALIQRLSEDDEADVRADAALALADAEARNAVDALLTATEDVQPNVRQMAVMALGELSPRGHKAACRAITAALRSDTAAARFQALIAAQKLGFVDYDDELKRALDDADAKVRYLALRLIDERLVDESDGAERLLEAAERALSDPELEVQVAAALVLAPAGHDEAQAALVLGINARIPLPAPEDEQSLIETVGELRLKAAEPGLLRHAFGLFGLVPGRFAWQAKIALARIGNPRARQEILRGLSSWDRDARTLSVVAAGRAGLGEARPRLQEMLQSETKVELSVIREALRELQS